MSEIKKNKFQKIVKRLKKRPLPFIGGIIFLFAFIVVSYAGLAGKYQTTTFRGSYSLEKLSDWTLMYSDGTVELFDSFPKSVNMREGETFSLVTTLPDDIPDDYGMMLYTNYCQICVYADDSVLMKYADKFPLPMGKLIGNIRFITPIPQDSQSATLRIDFTPCYFTSGDINPITFGDTEALKLSVIYSNLWRICVSLFALTIALICFGIYFYHRLRENTEHDSTFYHIGAFLAYLCIWLICSSDVPQMYINANEAVSLASFFSLILTIIHLAGYCGAVLDGKKNFTIFSPT